MRVDCFHLLTTVAAALPPRLGYAVADRVGDLWYLAAPRARAAVAANLRHVLGGQPADQRLVRQVFRHGARNYYDTLRIPALSPETLQAWFRVDGWDHLDRARAAGQGAILVGAHLSSVALAGQLVVLRGYPLVAVVEPTRPRWLFTIVTRFRAARGARLLPLSPGVLGELSLALRRNEIVGLVADRDVVGTGVPVQFFDAPAAIPQGPAVLALRTGAPLLISVVLRQSHGHFRGVIEPPLAVHRSGNTRRDIAALTRQIVMRFEYYIRRNPDQWTVFQPIWPEGEHERRGGL